MQSSIGIRSVVIAVALAVTPAAAAALSPADISPAGASASAPRIASDGAGNIAAIWREVDGDVAAIRAAFRPAGEGWGGGRRLSLAAPATEAPQLAMDRLGNAVAVWHRSTGSDSVVQVSIKPAGSAWSAARDLSLPGELAFNAHVAVEAGRMTAVWAAKEGLRSVVRAAAGTVAGGWQPAETVSGPISNAYAPVIALDDRGGAVAAWQWWDGAYLVVQAALRSPGGDWSRPDTLSGAGRDASRPRVAMDAAGNALVGWIRSNGTWLAAQVSSRPAGGTWSAPTSLSKRGGNTRQLDVVLNRRGDAAVAWHGDYGGQWTSFRPAGAVVWGARLQLPQSWGSARIALDEAGNATAVWSGSGNVSASFKPAGDPWQDDYLLSGYDFNAAHVAVTTQTPRNATAIWIRVGDEDDRVQGVSYDIDTAKEESQQGGEDEEEDDSGEEGQLLRGTTGADRLVGTAGNDVFYGLEGDDVIVGLGGRDVVYGGAGRDRIAGGRGKDRLVGGAGGDRLVGGRGGDVLIGGPGRDILIGGRGNDALRARDLRPDLVFGGRGLDRYRLDRWLDRARSIESRL